MTPKPDELTTEQRHGRTLPRLDYRSARPAFRRPAARRRRDPDPAGVPSLVGGAALVTASAATAWAMTGSAADLPFACLPVSLPVVSGLTIATAAAVGLWRSRRGMDLPHGRSNR